MKSHFPVALSGLFFAAVACEAGFPWSRPIGAGPLQRDELISVALDNEVFEATRDDFADLRIEEDRNRAVPYLLERREQTETRIEEIREPGAIFSLSKQENNAIELAVRPEQKRFVPTWLEFESPLRNFEKRVSVWGRPANGRPVLLAEQQPIFDHSRFVDVRTVRIRLTKAERIFPTYLVRIDNVTDIETSALAHLARRRTADGKESQTVKNDLFRRDFRIDRIWFGAEVMKKNGTAPVLAARRVRLESTSRDPKKKRSELLVSSRRQPLTTITLRTPDQNFSRAVTVQAWLASGEGPREWQTIGRGRVDKLSFRNLHRQQLTVPVRETRAERYRILLEDQDAPPLEITAVEAAGPVYQLVFLGAAGRTYHLLYGDPDAQKPTFDRAVLRTIRSEKGQEMTSLALGPPRPLESARKPRLITLLNRPGAMTAGVVLALAVLGFGIFRVLRRIDSAPDGDGTTPRPGPEES